MRTFFFHLFLSCAFLASCQQNVPKTESQINKVISIDEAEKLLVDNQYVQIIDVRTPEEYAEGHLKNCRPMNFYDDNFEENLAGLDKTKPVLVYCKAGGRSAEAASAMQKMGFSEVYDLKDGYDAWSEAGKDIEK